MLWAGTPSIRSDCSKSCPKWPPGLDYPQPLLWITRPNVSEPLNPVSVMSLSSFLSETKCNERKRQSRISLVRTSSLTDLRKVKLSLNQTHLCQKMMKGVSFIPKKDFKKHWTISFTFIFTQKIYFLSVIKILYFRVCFLQYILFLRCWRQTLGSIIPYLVCARPYLTQSITLTQDLSFW